MLVKEIMNTAIRTVSTEDKILSVASVMCLYRIHSLPVVDEKGDLVSIIAEKDVLSNLFPTVQDVAEGEAV
ncbi:MAG: CBS domain-containing protein, partial [Pseudomonadota bacterium]